MKYELFGEANEYGLRRIRALTDIPRYGVKAGDVGCWLQTEKNLSQEGDAWVYGNARVYDDARVKNTTDYLTIGPIGRDNDVLTAFRCADGVVRATRGCFYGTLDELNEASEKTHDGTKHRAVYTAAISLIRSQMEITAC